MKQGGWHERNILLLSTLLTILILLTPATHALGLAYEYMENNTILVPKGTERVFRITLQNEQNESLYVNVSVHSDVAHLRNDHNPLYIPAQNYNTATDILITVPQDAATGTVYQVGYSIQPVQEKPGEGQVPFSIRYDRGFNVQVSDPAPQPALPTEPIIQQPAPITQQQNAFDSMSMTIILFIIIALTLLIVWRGSAKLSHSITRRREQQAQQQQSPTPASAAAPVLPVTTTASVPVAQTPLSTQWPIGTTGTTKTRQDATSESSKQATTPETSLETFAQEPSQMSMQTIAQTPSPTVLAQPNSTTTNTPTPAPLNSTNTSPSEEQAASVALATPFKQGSRFEDLAREVRTTFSQPTFKATDQQRFFVHNGPALEDLRELCTALANMSNDQFSHHVNNDRHDFAAWVEGVFSMHDLAGHMRAARTREALLEVIEHEI